MERMIKSGSLLAVALLASTVLSAQQEGPVATQTVVTVDSKTHQTLSTQNLKVKVNGRATDVSNVVPVSPNGVQIAFLMDDGLRSSVGRQLGDIKSFITSLPPGTEIFLGYMQNGRVVSAQDFTTDHASAAKNLRIPLGSPGLSASPYFCLSDFVQKWPQSTGGAPRTRFIMMLTNGVDPYNGSVSPTNQNSVYVDNAIRDAQRAGVPVYSIYYGDAGIRGGAASFSGQSYLSKVAEGTGGRAYFQGTGNPVSLSPFLTQFTKSIAESFVATYNANARANLVDVRFSTTLPSTKVRAPQRARPGTRIGAAGQATVSP